MFSGHQHLKKRTPEGGIGRGDFIEHLVEEYYTTTNIEAQEQVTANLANFAYDPINWKFLIGKGAVTLFVELLAIPNDRLQLHGIAGLCNICFDPQALVFLRNSASIAVIVQLFLTAQNPEIILNVLTLFYQLLSIPEFADQKPVIIKPEVLKRIHELQQESSDKRLKNLAALYLEDFGRKTEVITILHSNQNDIATIDKTTM